SASRKPAAYQVALRQAEEACRLIPRDGRILSCVGAAQYRLRQDSPAVETLKNAVRIAEETGNVTISEILAILCLAEHRLGQIDSARANLSRLREAMKSRQRAQDADAQALFAEVEAIAPSLDGT